MKPEDEAKGAPPREEDLRRWSVEMGVSWHGQNPEKNPLDAAKEILAWVKAG